MKNPDKESFTMTREELAGLQRMVGDMGYRLQPVRRSYYDEDAGAFVTTTEKGFFPPGPVGEIPWMTCRALEKHVFALPRRGFSLLSSVLKELDTLFFSAEAGSETVVVKNTIEPFVPVLMQIVVFHAADSEGIDDLAKRTVHDAIEEDLMSVPPALAKADQQKRIEAFVAEERQYRNELFELVRRLNDHFDDY